MAEEKKEIDKQIKELKDKIKDDKKLDDDAKVKKVNDLISDSLKDLKTEKEKIAVLRKVDKKELEKFYGGHEKELTLIEEDYDGKIEPKYFWIIGFMRDDLGMKEILKILDTYSASEASGFYQKMGAGIGGLQDRVGNYMGTVGNLLKNFFKYMREMKILKSFLTLIEESNKIMGDRKFVIDLHSDFKNAAEIALKARWIDVVEGGTQNKGSVLGLAQQVGFGTLPQLFFHTHVRKPEDVADAVKNYEKEMPQMVRDILIRKLKEYMHWREDTYTAYIHRKNILLANIKQIYYSIKTYIEWLKPLLRTLKRMQMDSDMKDSADILAAIEQSIIEVRLFGKAAKNGKYNGIVDVSLRFRTFPEARYDQRSQSNVITHSGRIELVLRSRIMTDDQIAAYKVWQEKDDVDLLTGYLEISEDNLNDMAKDMWTYITEAEKEKSDKEPKKEEKKEKPSGKAYEPFVEIFRGFRDIGKVFIPDIKSGADKKDAAKSDDEKDKKDAREDAAKKLWTLYNVYKKSNRMVTW